MNKTLQEQIDELRDQNAALEKQINEVTMELHRRIDAVRDMKEGGPYA